MSKWKTKKDVVNEALKQYVASLKKKKLLSLREKDTWNGDLRQTRENMSDPILFDTSVWIDFLNKKIYSRGRPVGTLC